MSGELEGGGEWKDAGEGMGQRGREEEHEAAAWSGVKPPCAGACARCGAFCRRSLRQDGHPACAAQCAALHPSPFLTTSGFAPALSRARKHAHELCAWEWSEAMSRGVRPSPAR